MLPESSSVNIRFGLTGFTPWSGTCARAGAMAAALAASGCSTKAAATVAAQIPLDAYRNVMALLPRACVHRRKLVEQRGSTEETTRASAGRPVPGRGHDSHPAPGPKTRCRCPRSSVREPAAIAEQTSNRAMTSINVYPPSRLPACAPFQNHAECMTSTYNSPIGRDLIDFEWGSYVCSRVRGTNLAALAGRYSDSSAMS